MTISFTVFSLLLIVASSQCGNWTVINPDDGSLVTLDLSPLNGITLDMVDTDSEPHHYIYSICQNNEICKGAYVMVKQTVPSDPNDCYIPGRWDVTKQPQYENINGGTWTFVYDNGDDDCGNPARTWSPTFVCTPGVIAIAGNVDEIPNSCFYEVEIKTKFACADWTTTTTAVPDGECIFKSENTSGHVLNMTSIRGKLLSGTDPDNEHLYYMYTPCINSANCGNNKVMAYQFDAMNFECKQSLAIWEGGFIEPNYVEGVGLWQFTYTNGESCNGGETVFNALWFCDRTATSPKVIQAKQIAPCDYQMIINSTLACG